MTLVIPCVARLNTNECVHFSIRRQWRVGYRLIFKRKVFCCNCINQVTFYILYAIKEETQKLPGGWSPQISRQSEHEDGKIARLTHQEPLNPRKYSWYSFLLEAELTPAIVWPGELCHLNIPMTPPGMEPAIF
jgi:hypothetical protein